MIEAIVDERVARAFAKHKPDEFFSTAEAARHARVTTKTVRRWIEAGRLAPHRAGRKLLVRRDDLDELLRNGSRDRDLSPERLAERDFG